MASVKYEKICSNKDNCCTKEEDHFIKCCYFCKGMCLLGFKRKKINILE